MFLEVYYEHYAENCKNRDWELEQMSIPYMVVIKEKSAREVFRQFLLDAGFRCVHWNGVYSGILVNVELKRFSEIQKACSYKCIGNRNYTMEEFMEEIRRFLNDV